MWLDYPCLAVIEITNYQEETWKYTSKIIITGHIVDETKKVIKVSKS
jgi:hypothetical protein